MPYTSKTSKPTAVPGGRKPLIGDIKAHHNILDYDGLPKGIKRHSDMLFIFQDVAPLLPLTKTEVALYNYLFRKTSAKDWKKGSLAIVWKSNKTIMHELGIKSKKTLTKSLNSLRFLGLIAHKDSPSRQRRGERNKNGYIVLDETYGIVMNPIAGMIDSFKKRIEAYRANHKRYQVVTKNRTILRREYEDMSANIETLLPQSYADKLYSLLMRLKDISIESKDIHTQERAIRAIKRALSSARKALALANDLRAMADIFSYIINLEIHRKGSKKDHPLINNTRTIPQSRNGLSDDEVAAPTPPKSGNGFIRKELDRIKAIEAAAASDTSYEQPKPSFAQTRAALPALLKSKVRSDHGFYQLYDLLQDNCESYGLSRKLLSYGRKMVGLERVCAIMAIIIEKRPILNSPSGYFKSLISKHEMGALNIDPSLFGIIDRRQNGTAHDQQGWAKGQQDFELDYDY